MSIHKHPLLVIPADKVNAAQERGPWGILVVLAFCGAKPLGGGCGKVLRPSGLPLVNFKPYSASLYPKRYAGQALSKLQSALALTISQHSPRLLSYLHAFFVAADCLPVFLVRFG